MAAPWTGTWRAPCTTACQCRSQAFWDNSPEGGEEAAPRIRRRRRSSSKGSGFWGGRVSTRRTWTSAGAWSWARGYFITVASKHQISIITNQVDVLSVLFSHLYFIGTSNPKISFPMKMDFICCFFIHGGFKTHDTPPDHFDVVCNFHISKSTLNPLSGSKESRCLPWRWKWGTSWCEGCENHEFRDGPSESPGSENRPWKPGAWIEPTAFSENGPSEFRGKWTWWWRGCEWSGCQKASGPSLFPQSWWDTRNC